MSTVAAEPELITRRGRGGVVSGGAAAQSARCRFAP